MATAPNRKSRLKEGEGMYVAPGDFIDGEHGNEDRVRKVQKELKKLDYYKDTVDGRYGHHTETAVKEFQKANGLREDGKVGPQTGGMLNEVYADKLEEDLEECITEFEEALEKLKERGRWY